jgi:SAM-dependent methyltransferase
MIRGSEHPICNYEGSAYRTEFWVQERAYEDAVERVALGKLLPPSGRRLVEIGAGFGRLVPLYAGYDEVVLFDYALSQLRKALDLLGDAASGGKPRYIYVAGDFYHLPFVPGAFDTVSMVRTLHHAADAPAVLKEIHETLARPGTFVLEYANKRNLKAVLRHMVGRQDWSPFDMKPVEFVDLNFDFHPTWIREQLREVGFSVETQRAVSHFRVASLKRVVPLQVLVAADAALQRVGGLLPITPSVFVRCAADGGGAALPVSEGLFKCPVCGSDALADRQSALVCTSCGAQFPSRGGILDFRSASARAHGEG